MFCDLYRCNLAYKAPLNWNRFFSLSYKDLGELGISQRMTSLAFALC